PTPEPTPRRLRGSQARTSATATRANTVAEVRGAPATSLEATKPVRPTRPRSPPCGGFEARKLAPQPPSYAERPPWLRCEERKHRASKPLKPVRRTRPRSPRCGGFEARKLAPQPPSPGFEARKLAPQPPSYAVVRRPGFTGCRGSRPRLALYAGPTVVTCDE